ncbi:MAG: hypothetical protein ACOCZE_11355, partial [Planctomycetota bacterium]
MTRTRKLQIVWIALAGLAFVAGGMMQDVVDERMAAYDLQPPERAVAQNHPELALLTVAPGPLRAPMVNYFWIRAQELKDEGRYYEANQLAEIICILQSRSPGVWAFHSWNMAWNISAAVKTAEERWLWVNNGLELLRDRGIPLNPRSFLLYRELAWIFFNKIGGNLDEMHGAYKSRFAQQMNAVLGAPPAGTASGAAPSRGSAEPAKREPGADRMKFRRVAGASSASVCSTAYRSVAGPSPAPSSAPKVPGSRSAAAAPSSTRSTWVASRGTGARSRSAP